MFVKVATARVPPASGEENTSELFVVELYPIPLLAIAIVVEILPVSVFVMVFAVVDTVTFPAKRIFLN